MAKAGEYKWTINQAKQKSLVSTFQFQDYGWPWFKIVHKSATIGQRSRERHNWNLSSPTVPGTWDPAVDIITGTGHAF